MCKECALDSWTSVLPMLKAITATQSASTPAVRGLFDVGVLTWQLATAWYLTGHEGHVLGNPQMQHTGRASSTAGR
jgi:hypothetical protein